MKRFTSTRAENDPLFKIPAKKRKYDSGTDEDVILVQDVNYVKKLIEQLNQSNPQTGKPFNKICDLSSQSPDGYDIIHSMGQIKEIKDEAGNPCEEVIIVGYPDPSKMNQYLKVQELMGKLMGNLMDEESSIFNQQVESYEELLVGLYSAFKTESEDEINLHESCCKQK